MLCGQPSINLICFFHLQPLPAISFTGISFLLCVPWHQQAEHCPCHATIALRLAMTRQIAWHSIIPSHITLPVHTCCVIVVLSFEACPLADCGDYDWGLAHPAGGRCRALRPLCHLHSRVPLSAGALPLENTPACNPGRGLLLRDWAWEP